MIDGSVRKEILDLFSMGVYSKSAIEPLTMSWHGKLDDASFLKRLYKLEELPSYDNRYSNAEWDIKTHTYSFDDWDDDWLFSDDRFDLLYCSDEQFLSFLAEVFHPVVVERSVNDPQSAEYHYLQEFNRLLAPQGFKLSKRGSLGGRPIIVWTNIKKNLLLESQENLISNIFDSDYLNQQITQMLSSVDSNPTDAIGKSKELIESCCKTILDYLDEPYDKNESVQKLVKHVTKELKLVPDVVDKASTAEKTIGNLANHLCTLVQDITELRNLYGSGHGKSDSFVSLEVRHARVAVQTSAMLCTFLWETYENYVFGV